MKIHYGRQSLRLYRYFIRGHLSFQFNWLNPHLLFWSFPLISYQVYQYWLWTSCTWTSDSRSVSQTLVKQGTRSTRLSFWGPRSQVVSKSQPGWLKVRPKLVNNMFNWLFIIRYDIIFHRVFIFLYNLNQET